MPRIAAFTSLNEVPCRLVPAWCAAAGPDGSRGVTRQSGAADERRERVRQAIALAMGRSLGTGLIMDTMS